MDTFNIANPTYASQKKTSTKVWQNDFGDGYSQRAARGLNSVSQEWSLTWSNLPYATINSIESFFSTRMGVTAFYWTPLRGAVPLIFICSSWSREFTGPDTDSLTATFTQVFDLP